MTKPYTIGPPGTTITVTCPSGEEVRVYEAVKAALEQLGETRGLVKLLDWEYSDDYQEATRRDERGNVVAEVVKLAEPVMVEGQPVSLPFGWLWKTPGREGHARSPASGTALADRQLRIDGYLPYLESKTVTVPTCGHIDCIGFMGCTVEAANKHGWPRPEEPRSAMPGAEVTMHKVMNTGMTDKDWVVEPRIG